jgi:hypothetical protein
MTTFGSGLIKVGLLAGIAVLGAGCSVSSQVSAVSVQAAGGQVVTNEWNASSGCRVAPGGGPPCSAQSERRHDRYVVP